MDRYTELKEKGWAKMNGEERAEYKTLEPGDTQAASPSITIPRNELEAMVNKMVADKMSSQIQRAQPSVSSTTFQSAGPAKKRIHTATLRKYQKDTESPIAIVTDWKFLRYDVDEFTRKRDKAVYKVTLRYSAEDVQVVEMSLEELNMMNLYEKVNILEKKNDPKEKVHGSHPRKFMDKEGYVQSETHLSSRFDLVERKDDFTCLIELENGEQLWLKEDRLNA